MLLAGDSLQRDGSGVMGNLEFLIITGSELQRSIISLFLLLPGRAYLSRKKKSRGILN